MFVGPPELDSLVESLKKQAAANNGFSAIPIVSARITPLYGAGSRDPYQIIREGFDVQLQFIFKTAKDCEAFKSCAAEKLDAAYKTNQVIDIRSIDPSGKGTVLIISCLWIDQ